MCALELRLLGTPQIFIDGRESTFRTRKALALLVFLVAEGGMHRRDKLAELLWPTSKSGRGRTALRSALSSIRRTLIEVGTGSGGGFLRVEGDLLGVEVGPELVLDLDSLEEASSAVAGAEGATGDLISTFRSADAAYRGEFLEGFSLDDAPEFDLWVEAQRATWRARIGNVMARQANVEAEAGELAAAAKTAERWVMRDPTEEAARVRLMRARSATGDPGGALAAYQDYRLALRDLGLEPGPDTEVLAAGIKEQLTAVRDDQVTGGDPGSDFGSPLRTPFVGRAAEFGTLVEEYRAAREGETRAALAVGEAGIGKTRLVEEFLGWAESRGAEVLRVRSFEAETRLPYGPLVDALRPRLERERAPDDLLEDRWLSELSRVLPEIGDRYPDLPPPTAAAEASSRAMLFEAVARLGAALAGRPPEAAGTGEPLVIFVDDLQWADGGTLDALRYACRSWARDGVPVLIVTTVRTEDLGTNDYLSRWISSLVRELPARRLALAPIGEVDINGLLRILAGVVGTEDGGKHEGLERLAGWLLGQSGGHPLFLAQIMGALLDQGVLAERVGQDGRREVALSERGFDEQALRGLVPAGLRELILDKLRPLSAHASDMLTAGAVLGVDFRFESLLMVAGLGESEGLSALDSLVSIRLLEEAEPAQHGAYSFAHHKIREFAYTEAGEARREVFHRRALENLEGRGASAADLVRHATSARLPAKIFHYLLAAAEEAMAVSAAGDAVGYYERARELLEDPPRGTPPRGAPERLRLYGGLGRALTLNQDFVGALEAYKEMLAVARKAEDRLAEWEALGGLTTLGVGIVVGPDDSERPQGAGRHEGPEESDGAIEPWIGEWEPQLAASGTAYSSTRVAQGYAEEALRLAHELGRDDLVSRSEFALGAACVWVQDWENAATHLERASPPGGEAADTGSFLRTDWSRRLVAWSKGLVEGPADAFGPTGALQNCWRESAKILEDIDTDYARAQLGGQALQCVVWGDYESALDVAPRAIEASLSLGQPQWLFMAIRGLGDAYREMLALPEAREVYMDRLKTHYPVPRWIMLLIQSELCAVAALEGEWERAREHALGAIEIRDEMFLPLTHLRHHLDIEALLRGGDAELVRNSLRIFEQRTRGQEGYFRLAYLRAEAVLTRWNGDMDGTLSVLYEAFGQAERLGLPGEIWQVGATLGEVHEERGEIGPSEQAFGRAAAVIRRLAAKIPDEKFRKGFLTAPQTRRVLEKARD